MKRILQTLVLVLIAQFAMAQQPCQADFGFMTDSTGNHLYLFDHSYTLDSTPINVTTYTWTVMYGGATYTFSNANPMVFINGYTGTVVVCLSIITTQPCTSSFCDTIMIGNPVSQCDADFTWAPAGLLHSIDFTDVSVPGSGSITSWSWTFQNGTPATSTLQNPTVTFPGNGLFNVCLTITTDSGCYSTNCYNVHVQDSNTFFCDADFTWAPDGTPHTIDFTDLSLPGLGVITSWYWTFQNGTPATSNQQNPTVTFPGNGLYNVCLFISTSDSCTSHACYNVHVQDSNQNNCQLNLNPTISHVTTIGASDGFIELNVTGGTPPYSFLWSTGATTDDIYGLSSGVYNVHVLQADSMCPPTFATFHIIEPYDTTLIDSLYIPIDTCLNFIPDTFFVNIITIDPLTVTVQWVFQGQGMTQSITVVYSYQNYGPHLIVLAITCDSAKSTTIYMSYINITSTFGIAEFDPDDFQVWPNPFDGNLNFSLPEGTDQAEVRIFNTKGSMMYSGAADRQVDASNWPSGIYYLQILYGTDGKVTRSIIKL